MVTASIINLIEALVFGGEVEKKLERHKASGWGKFALLLSLYIYILFSVTSQFELNLLKPETTPPKTLTDPNRC